MYERRTNSRKCRNPFQKPFQERDLEDDSSDGEKSSGFFAFQSTTSRLVSFFSWQTVTVPRYSR